MRRACPRQSVQNGWKDSSLTESPGKRFLSEGRERRFVHSLKRQTVLGLTLGCFVLAYALAHLYFVPTQHEVLQWLLVALGLSLLLAAIIVPQSLAPIERVLHAVGSFVGENVLKASLILVYFVIMTPIGAAMRAVRGTAPIHSWTGKAPPGLEGWRSKSLTSLVRDGKASRTSFVSILDYFVKGGKIIFLPSLVILLGLGMALYFVKTSVIAPFIYTLF